MLKTASLFSEFGKRYTGLVGCYTTINIIVAVLPALLLWLSKGVIDTLVQSPLGVGDVREKALYLAGAYLFGLVCQSSFTTVLGTVQSFLSDRFHFQVNSSLMRRTGDLKNLEYFEDPEFHDSRLVVQYQSPYAPLGLIRYVTDLCSVSIGIASLIFILAELSIAVPLAILVGAVPIAMVELRIHKLRFEGTQETASAERKRDYALGLLTSFGSAKEVKLFDLYKPTIELYRRVSEKIELLRRGVHRSTLLLGVGSTGWSTLWTGLPYIWVIYRTVQGDLSLGQLAMYTGGIQLMSQQVGRLAQSIAGHQLVFRQMALLGDWLNLPLRTAAPKGEIKSRASGKGMSIEFRNVSFTYPGNSKPAVSHFSASVRAGSLVAIVGENGSGKTTLVKLLCRLYEPSDGEILIDDVGVSEYDIDALRKSVAVIFQDFMKYDFSLKYNVIFGDLKEAHNSARLQLAEKDARLDEIVDELAEGYNTQLGKRFEGGVDLSLGQWQRVAIARGAFRNGDLLIMDEPSASLDITSEVEINQRMREIARGRTTVLISHRFSSVRMADHIFVMNQGGLVEQGDHDFLIKQSGYYAEMYRLQAERFGLVDQTGA